MFSLGYSQNLLTFIRKLWRYLQNVFLSSTIRLCTGHEMSGIEKIRISLLDRLNTFRKVLCLSAWRSGEFWSYIIWNTDVETPFVSILNGLHVTYPLVDRASIWSAKRHLNAVCQKPHCYFSGRGLSTLRANRPRPSALRNKSKAFFISQSYALICDRSEHNGVFFCFCLPFFLRNIEGVISFIK
jgi:hypothetical protein